MRQPNQIILIQLSKKSTLALCANSIQSSQFDHDQYCALNLNEIFWTNSVASGLFWLNDRAAWWRPSSENPRVEKRLAWVLEILARGGYFERIVFPSIEFLGTRRGLRLARGALLMATSPESGSGNDSYDNQGQYSRKGILRYEKVFGEGYVSTGGPATTRRLAAKLGSALCPGARVLDVGSGLGGAAFDLARDYGVDVTGIDLAPNMVEITMERVATSATPQNVRFLVADILTVEFDQPFDIVWSRDALMHLPDKQALFAKIASLTKDGGHLVITDYAKGAGERSSEFTSYAQNTGYHLLDLQSYGKVLEQAGFRTVVVEDATDSFDQILEDEQTRLTEIKQQFIQDFSEADWTYLMDRWEMKQGFIKQGDMKWGIFHAIK